MKSVFACRWLLVIGLVIFLYNIVVGFQYTYHCYYPLPFPLLFTTQFTVIHQKNRHHHRIRSVHISWGTLHSTSDSLACDQPIRLTGYPVPTLPPHNFRNQRSCFFFVPLPVGFCLACLFTATCPRAGQPPVCL